MLFILSALTPSVNKKPFECVMPIRKHWVTLPCKIDDILAGLSDFTPRFSESSLKKDIKNGLAKE